MKIGVVNGSPRKRGSASENIIGALRERLGKAPEYALCNAMSQNGREIVSALLGCYALVFVFPLYLDGAPSHLLRFLEESREQISGAAPAAVVYAVVNNGFYEPAQNILAINTIKSFCVKSGLKWGQGVCAGGGGMIGARRIGRSPLKNLGMALDALAENVLQLKTAEDRLVKPDIPRFFYLCAASVSMMFHMVKNRL